MCVIPACRRPLDGRFVHRLRHYRGFGVDALVRPTADFRLLSNVDRRVRRVRRQHRDDVLRSSPSRGQGPTSRISFESKLGLKRKKARGFVAVEHLYPSLTFTGGKVVIFPPFVMQDRDFVHGKFPQSSQLFVTKVGGQPSEWSTFSSSPWEDSSGLYYKKFRIINLRS